MKPDVTRWLGCLVVASVLLVSVPLAGQRGQSTQETGIAVKRPVLAAACKVCPWGGLGDILKEAMAPYGYDVQVCYNCSMANNPRLVGDRKIPPSLSTYTGFVPLVMMPPPPNGPVDFGVTSVPNIVAAFRGTGAFVSDGPRRQLRLIANIQSPSYIIVAVKADLGITDLGQIKAKRWPVRVLTGGESDPILAYYGLTPKMIQDAGGHVGPGNNPAERANYDVIIANGSLGNAPEYNIWYEASQKYDLKFLQLPDELLAKLVKDSGLEMGTIPLGLLRGVDRPIRTAVRTGTAFYGRADMSDDFAYVVARAVDEHQALLQWSHLNFSYNWRTVWKADEIPLHPGAERYYKEVRYVR
jgi:uncharacterized protein